MTTRTPSTAATGQPVTTISDRLGGEVAAHRGAFNRTWQSRIGPIAGQEEARERRGPRRRARGLAGREREGGPALSHDRRLPHDGSAGLRQRITQLAQRGAHDGIVGERDDGARAARDQRHVRPRRPGDGPVIERPLQRPARQSHERRREHAAVEPEVHRHNRIAPHARGARHHRRQRSRDLVEEMAQGEPRDRRNDRARPRLPAASRANACRAAALDDDARKAVGPHLAAACFDVVARRRGVHRVERNGRERN